MAATIEYLIAEAYARGRTDAGDHAFMDDGFSTATTTGAFAFRYAEAHPPAVDGGSVPLLPLAAAWSVFCETLGRSVEAEHAEQAEEEMATREQVAAVAAALEPGQWPAVCMVRATYPGGQQLTCTLAAGHSGPHTATVNGRVVDTWTNMSSDAAVSRPSKGEVVRSEEGAAQ